MSKYLSRLSPVAWEPSAPSPGCRAVAAIPVLGELETLPRLLDSIAGWGVPAVLAVNQQPDTPELYKLQNAELLSMLRGGRFPGVYFLDFTGAYLRPPGVGSARKAAMDAAVLGFGTGIILFSLDGDTLVEPNYFDEVMAAFAAHPEWAAAAIDFEHSSSDAAELTAARCYERYLRHYRDGLVRAGSPYAYIPLGSAMAVRGAAYVKAGGMRTNSGGEDFYFLQAVRKTGKVGEIFTTRVHPSARPSDRVPFGTGPRVRRIMETGSIEFEPDWVFDELAAVIAAVENAATAGQLINLEIPGKSAQFFSEQHFYEDWNKITANTAHEPARLRQAFHVWFDAFRTLKLIHFLKQHHGLCGDAVAAPGEAELLGGGGLE